MRNKLTQKKRILQTWLTVLVMSFFLPIVAAAGKGYPDTSQWGHDAEFHWNLCIEENCDIHIYNKSAHTNLRLVRTIKEATCLETGKAVFNCDICGEIEKTTKALGHDFSNTYTIDRPATQTVVGLKSRHCSRCKEVTDLVEIPKLPAPVKKPDPKQENKENNKTEVTGITLSKSKLSFSKKGQKAALTAKITPATAANKTVKWKSSNTKVATVDANGNVTAVGNGTAKITATSVNGKTASATVTVSIIDSVKFLKNFKGTWSGKKLKLSWGKLKGADGYLVYLQYCGKNYKKEATKDIKSGNTISITFPKLNGKAFSPSCCVKTYVVAYKNQGGKKVKLSKTPDIHIPGKSSKYTNTKKIALKKSKIILNKGASAKIQASIIKTDKKKKQLGESHVKPIRYLTSDKDVATVNAKGKITAKGSGTCYIFVYGNNGNGATVTVTVK